MLNAYDLQRIHIDQVSIEIENFFSNRFRAQAGFEFELQDLNLFSELLKTPEKTLIFFEIETGPFSF